MAATGTPTPNLGLRIPQGTDPASVDDINYNSNLLDTKIGAVGNDSVQDQIDSLNSKVTPTATPSGSPTTLRKIGNLVFMNTTNAVIPNDYVIPSGYRPNDYTAYGTVMVVHNSSWVSGAIKIATDGTITVEYVPGGTASTRQIAGSLMWVTA